jgi:dimethylargininase|tara:strand:+ start:11106 stop:11897 length:792 start_codon:yes stop_codon:yes gene_type:complete
MPGTFDRTRGRALTREVSPLFSDAVTEFFGTKAPDYAAALGAQEAYFAALRAHGTDVVTLPALDGYPDCSFTEDTAVMIDGKAIVTNLGHPSRRGEQDSVAEFLSDDFEIVRMPDGSTLDGGDVVFFDDCFLVGLSTRTNREGAEFLASHAESAGLGTRFIEVPGTTLHLTTVCSSPRPGLIIAAEGQLTAGDLSFAEEVIWVPSEEGYAANTIAYGDRVILSDGYPKTRQLLMDAGFSITTVEMSEFREVDASLTCLSVFIG